MHFLEEMNWEMVQYWVNNALHLLSENLEDVNVTDSVNLRAVILDILLEVNEHDAYSHIVMNNALSKYQYLDKNERAFITRLAGGTIEKQIELDYIIDSFSKTKTAIFLFEIKILTQHKHRIWAVIKAIQ